MSETFIQDRRRWAAAFVRLTGCVEVGLFGSCAVGLHRADALTGRALGLMIGLGLAPGLIYLGLGFGVRAGKAAAIYMAMLIALTQAVVLIVLLTNATLTALAQGDPLEFTKAVLFLGSLLGLIVVTIRRLWQALTPADGGGKP